MRSILVVLVFTFLCSCSPDTSPPVKMMVAHHEEFNDRLFLALRSTPVVLVKKSPIVERIEAEARKRKVDPSLAVAVAYVESKLNQRARNRRSGAIGLFQLMPNTAAHLGVNPHTTAGNITGGVKYLREMLVRFKGNETMALAAYNAGPTRVAKLGRVPNIRQTKNYIRDVQREKKRR